jgi:hypothetical protein
MARITFEIVPNGEQQNDLENQQEPQRPELIGHIVRCNTKASGLEFVKDGDRFVNRYFTKLHETEEEIIRSKFPHIRAGEEFPITSYDMNFCPNARAVLDELLIESNPAK